MCVCEPAGHGGVDLFGVEDLLGHAAGCGGVAGDEGPVGGVAADRGGETFAVARLVGDAAGVLGEKRSRLAFEAAYDRKARGRVVGELVGHRHPRPGKHRHDPDVAVSEQLPQTLVVEVAVKPDRAMRTAGGLLDRRPQGPIAGNVERHRLAGRRHCLHALEHGRNVVRHAEAADIDEPERGSLPARGLRHVRQADP